MGPVMKTITLLSAILILPAASLLAQGQSDIDLLKARIDVQERRISQLENALIRLNGQAVKKADSVETKVAPAKAVPVAETSKATGEYVVKQGDTLTRIASRNKTTVAVLKKENNLQSDALNIGQKLRVPATVESKPVSQKAAPTPQVAKKAEAVKSAPVTSSKYTVKSGDTFYGIARQYNMSEATLQASNPKAVPTRLQIGQKLVIDANAKPVSKPAPVAKKAPNKKAPSKAPSKSVAQSSPGQASAPKTSTPAPKKTTGIRTITVNEQMTYGTFANRHGASTSQLNSLNGLNLSKSTMLAKGSELYVPQY